MLPQRWGLGSIANKPPVAYGQTVDTTQNTSVAITLIAADPDGDPLTYTIAIRSGKRNSEWDRTRYHLYTEH